MPVSLPSPADTPKACSRTPFRLHQVSAHKRLALTMNLNLAVRFISQLLNTPTRWRNSSSTDAGSVTVCAISCRSMRP